MFFLFCNFVIFFFFFFLFFFNDTATTEIYTGWYTLSLHDALPILPRKQGDELWKRFRAACDRFFERRKPELEARRSEETSNLEAKQQLIARAQAIVAAAPAERGWGQSIAEIKDLQRAWKDIGFVPRRDADAVYKAFRVACDSL